MSDLGIDIPLSVTGVDVALSQLRLVADMLAKAGVAAKFAAGAAAPGGSAGTAHMTATTVTLNAATVILHTSAQMQQNNIQINTWNQANQQVNGFREGLLNAKSMLLVAVGAVDKMAKAAIDAGAALAQIGLTAGGNLNQSAQLSGLGNAFGFDAAGLARQFTSRIASDALAASAANRIRIHGYGPTDPNLNAAEKLLAAADFIRSASEHEAQMFARQTGLEDLLKIRLLSDRSYANLRVNDPATQARIMDPQFQKDMVEIQYGIARITMAFTNLIASVLKPSGGDLAGKLNEIADSFNKLADFFNEHANQVKGMIDILMGLSIKMLIDPIGAMQDLIRGIKELGTPNKPIDRHTTAIDRNTAALDANTYATQNGIYGGGDRARGAVPSKWMGRSASVYIENAKRLGAFNL